MFKARKRLLRVDVSFKHGEEELLPEVIAILPGQSFIKGIEADSVMQGNMVVRQYSWKAGYTEVYEYFYV